MPPGQHVIDDAEFPVLTAGATPRIALDQWMLVMEYAGQSLARWSWAEFQALPQTEITADIHCVTKWSKLGTRWRGVTFDDLLRAANIALSPTAFVMAHCEGGYTTNVPVADLVDRKGIVATHYDGEPLSAPHGGPARLLVPHLYFWKSAKWIRRLSFIDADRPGFWESLGYHGYGDPWREQRYTGDP